MFILNTGDRTKAFPLLGSMAECISYKIYKELK